MVLHSRAGPIYGPSTPFASRDRGRLPVSRPKIHSCGRRKFDVLSVSD